MHGILFISVKTFYLHNCNQHQKMLIDLHNSKQFLLFMHAHQFNRHQQRELQH